MKAVDISYKKVTDKSVTSVSSTCHGFLALERQRERERERAYLIAHKNLYDIENQSTGTYNFYNKQC